MVNRIAIFIFYDRQGIVDDYVPYFLERLQPFLSNLIIVVNGQLTVEGRKKLNLITKNIFVRENVGYEPGAIKDVLFKFYGMSEILKYDELLICNDSFYGPFFDIKEVFSKMDKIECDFWGITEQAARKGSYPKHIQSYFYNTRKDLLHSKHFRCFFEKLPLPKNLNQAVKDYEIKMSQNFLKAGFSYASFINVEDFIEEDAKKNFNYSITTPMDLLKKRCPFIKKKAFFCSEKATFPQGGEQSGYLMHFINDYIKYPQKIIWQNLLRIANITDIKNILHLQYIFPKDILLSNSKKLENRKVVVIVHLFYIELLNESLAYLDNIPKFINLVITTPKPEIAEFAQRHFDKKRKCEIRLVENRGRDIAVLLVYCKDILQKYDYLCFTHDKNRSGQSAKIEASSFRFLLWECTIASEYYIKNVLSKFENEPELGFLNVPQPFHGWYLNIFKDEWGNNFPMVKDMLKNLKLNCNLQADIPPFAIGTAFWAKCKALEPLFNFNINDFPQEPLPLNGTISHAIERIFPYIAQSQGYYSGICLTDSYAQIRINYLEFIIRREKREREKEKEREKKILLFARLYSKIYIYGAGVEGKKVANILRDFKIDYKGFIVSRKEKDIFLKHRIYELGEIKMDKNTGIILGLNKKNSLEVLRILKEWNINRGNILRIET